MCVAPHDTATTFTCVRVARGCVCADECVLDDATQGVRRSNGVGVRALSLACTARLDSRQARWPPTSDASHAQMWVRANVDGARGGGADVCHSGWGALAPHLRPLLRVRACARRQGVGVARGQPRVRTVLSARPATWVGSRRGSVSPWPALSAPTRVHRQPCASAFTHPSFPRCQAPLPRNHAPDTTHNAWTHTS